MRELIIDEMYWPAVRGVKKLTLMISIEALHNLLSSETAVIAEEDVPLLMRAIADHANGSHEDLVEKWRDFCDAHTSVEPNPD